MHPKDREVKERATDPRYQARLARLLESWRILGDLYADAEHWNRRAELAGLKTAMIIIDAVFYATETFDGYDNDVADRLRSIALARDIFGDDRKMREAADAAEPKTETLPSIPATEKVEQDPK